MPGCDGKLKPSSNYVRCGSWHYDVVFIQYLLAFHSH